MGIMKTLLRRCLFRCNNGPFFAALSLSLDQFFVILHLHSPLLPVFLFVVQWVREHVGEVHIIAPNYAGTYRRCAVASLSQLTCSLFSFEILFSEGFLHPITMARSVYTAVAYAHHCCQVPIRNVLLYSQVAVALCDAFLPNNQHDYQRSFICAVYGWYGCRVGP